MSYRAVSKDPRQIQGMFARIAPVYDLLNHVLSLNIDQSWRRYTARCLLRPTDERVLDVACGTGDLTKELRRQAPAGCQVSGLDFCLPMLRIAQRKDPAPFLHGDAMRLPFGEGSFDAMTIAFGLRNVADAGEGLREMLRVLRPGGRLAVLEFTTPTLPGLRQGYLFYFRHMLPTLGKLVSRSGAYEYLRDSVLEWPEPRALARMMHDCGYERVRFTTKTFGIVALHIGEKPRE